MCANAQWLIMLSSNKYSIVFIRYRGRGTLAPGRA
jgi:hypothetical protein